VRVIVLGSAAGGANPQWSCACPSCQAARRGGAVKPRSQDSIAVSADGRRWVLLNVSPDVTRQIGNTGVLQPAAGARSSPIIGVVLTNGDLDHSMGLLSLPEATPLCLYATRETYAGLVVQHAVFRTLERQRRHVLYRALELDVFIPLRDVAGAPSGLSSCAFPVAGKVPPHLESFIEATDETNVGLIVRDDNTGARVLYVPGAASAEGIALRARDATCLFFDGTFWSDAELTAFGQSPQLAREMAHLPVSGPHGSLEQLDTLPIRQRYYTHVGDTNPMLREGSEERREVEARGWSVAEDGLELSV
jgi:pyrroloquinoline quinone biosynthesis protein B